MKRALPAGLRHRVGTVSSWRGCWRRPHWLTALQTQSRLGERTEVSTVTQLADPALTASVFVFPGDSFFPIFGVMEARAEVSA